MVAQRYFVLLRICQQIASIRHARLQEENSYQSTSFGLRCAFEESYDPLGRFDKQYTWRFNARGIEEMDEPKAIVQSIEPNASPGSQIIFA